MSDEIHHKYRSNLRGNQDVLLADIRRSPEFEAIEQKYLKNVFMGIYRLLGRVEGNDDNARKVYACADEISRTFKISKKNALQLLLTANVPAVYGARYMPHVKRDGDEVVMRFGRKTTLADIKAVWHIVKDVQREIGSTGSKKSINPELAFCIHRQHILKGRKIADIFDDYLHKRLEGYEGKPPTLGENDFRKYYKGVVEGL
ncbi:MAG: hypothetical protein HXL06_003635 [Candidatus Nanosynbacter sp. HMT-348_TM7c-JB]|nr:hypothetical protein FBF25_03865 [Candidatus Saccharibacteria bacterium oral taxon 488]QLF52170.1 hypothetical protein HW277_03915 [Candidatus Saccharibacteria bacterium oral taxon 488]RKW46815.1 MAG: hypothetical protein D8B41_02680 [Porphyromonas sp.]UJD06452.1 MAG: hypothetical protein HXL06_003635 [Candidatus Nanosynbacter sp. HMT-348_TM7c-JB]